MFESEIKLVNRKKSGKTSFQQQYIRWKKSLKNWRLLITERHKPVQKEKNWTFFEGIRSIFVPFLPNRKTFLKNPRYQSTKQIF